MRDLPLYFDFTENVEGFIDFLRNYVIFFLDPIYIGDERVEAEVVARVREYYFDAPRCRVKDNALNRAVDVSILTANTSESSAHDFFSRLPQ